MHISMIKPSALYDALVDVLTEMLAMTAVIRSRIGTAQVGLCESEAFDLCLTLSVHGEQREQLKSEGKRLRMQQMIERTPAAHVGCKSATA